MAHANAARRLSWNEPATPETVEERAAAGLPPHGQSPALDLQRRLGEAALRGFYAPEPWRPKMNGRRLTVVAASAIVSWGVVFGAGSLLIG